MKQFLLLSITLISTLSFAQDPQITINQPEDKILLLIDKTCDNTMKRISVNETASILGGDVKFQCKTLTFNFEPKKEYNLFKKRNPITYTHKISIFDSKINNFILNQNNKIFYYSIRNKIESKYGKSNELKIANQKIKQKEDEKNKILNNAVAIANKRIDELLK